MGTVGHMGMTIRTRMADSLTLFQWLSPSFPVGAFAYSHGVEQVIAEGGIAGAASLELWLEDFCRFGAGQSDLTLLAAAYKADDPTSVDEVARAMAASAERLKETDLQGAAFVDTVNAVWALKLPRLTYPVAVGTAARARQIALPDTLELYLHALVANLTSVAVRLVPLGQTDGQQVLTRLHPLIRKTAAEIRPLEAISSTAFAGDIAAMRHETLDTRIYRT